MMFRFRDRSGAGEHGRAAGMPQRGGANHPRGES